MREARKVEWAFSATDPSVVRETLFFIRQGSLTIAGPIKQTDGIRITDERNFLVKELTSAQERLKRMKAEIENHHEYSYDYHAVDCWVCEALSHEEEAK